MTTQISTSHSQEALWLDGEGAVDPARHNLLWCVRLDGPVDLAALEAALTRIIERHEALRTVFRFAETGLTGLRLEADPVHLDVIDLTCLDSAGRAARLDDFGLMPYVLGTGPLYRFALFTADGESGRLACGFHHLVMDGGSWIRFYNELALELAGEAVAAAPCSYADWAAAERQRLAAPEAGASARDHWHAVTGGRTAAWPLPWQSAPRPAADAGPRGRVSSAALPATLHDTLQDLSARVGVSPFRILAAALAAWIAALSERRRLALSTVFTGRDHATADMIGYFVQLGLIMVEPGPDDSLVSLVRQVDASIRAARQHETYPAALALRTLRRDHDPARMPFSPVSVVRMPDGPPRCAGALTLSQHRVFLPVADRAVSVYVEPGQAGTRLSWVVRRDLVDAAGLARMVTGFTDFLTAALAEPDRQLDALARVSPAAAVEVERLGRGPDEPRLPGQRLHQPLLDQVVRTPDRIALVEGERSWRYQELAARAARLAGELVAAGTKPGEAIGLVMPVSAELVIAELACMMAGLVFTPLDPDWPVARIRAVLDQLDAPVALKRSADDVADELTGIDWLAVDAGQDLADVAATPFRPGRLDALPDPAPLYCFFTSGSTGRPKGAVNSHAGVLNRLQAMSEMFGVPSGDVVLAGAAGTTDTSVWLFFWPLLHGGRTVLASRETMAVPEQITALCRRAGVTVTDMVPAMLHDWVAHLSALPRNGSPLPRLRLLSVGGETMRAADVKAVHTLLPHVGVYNTYGPTEASIGTVFHRVERGATDPVPIGRPLANVRVAIVDAAGRAAPVGIPGELCLAGTCLGLGYLGNAEASRRVFVDLSPFGGTPRRYYRTGDRAWLDETGVFHFLGRIDHQVQINGNRVEPGEVEAALHRLAGISQAAVIPERADADAAATGLVAYVEAQTPGAAPDLAQIRRALLSVLPRHMLPTRLVVLEHLPLTGTGKPDRVALKAADRGAVMQARRARAPETPLETDIARVWSDTLGLAEIGTEDDFFTDLGGDSLRGLQAMLGLESLIGLPAGLRTLYEAPTVRQLAARFGEAPGLGARNRLTAVTDRLQRSLAGWPGRPVRPGGLLRTLGPEDTPAHMFWCCQTGREMEQLAAALGAGTGFTAMRSGHLVMDYEPDLVTALAERYADEVEALRPDGAILVGGNCQGARIAIAVAGVLTGRGRKVSRAILLDQTEFETVPCPVTLVLGAVSHVGSGRQDQALQARLAAQCPSGLTMAVLPGAHGEYFRTGNVEVLADIIRQAL
ncbi:amino acid adenylation domain-containing protein [Maricaulis sp.]|uniref:non-ribosomal peptide synthetase n=1 Tax=Maricaulis sp. TaxID=1486257 RepID=UPI0025B9E054|nr:amino acid adenylation domain-containing protein [Maricaulis sp.]